MSESNLSNAGRFLLSLDNDGHFVYDLKTLVVDLVHTDHFAAASEIGTCGHWVWKKDAVHPVVN